jgi:hypothetical protein
VQNGPRMSLNHRSDSRSRSFVSRYLLAPRTTAAAVLALGLGVAASSARADETVPAAPAAAAPVASVSEVPAAAPSANVARPLNMRDLGTRSSIGLRAEGGYVSVDSGDGAHAVVGALTFDGELAVTDNIKVFASFPLSGFEADNGPESDNESDGGHGNLTLGAQLQGGENGFSAALGGSYSNFGADDGTAGIYLHDDITSYVNGAPIVRGYGSVRGGSDDQFLQGELSYVTAVDDDAQGGFGKLVLGGGARIDANRMFLGELGVLRYIGDHDEGAESLYLADIGMRGTMGEGSKGSWGAKLSLLHAEGITTVGVGFDWRTDLPGLSGQ